MAITLADAALNTQDDIDLAIIDEFRKSSFLLDTLTFDDSVNPSGGGAVLTYGYTRVITERPAGFRAIGSEYTAAEAKRQRYTVDLKPLGGKYTVDRVIAHLGPAASDEVAFQTEQLIKSTKTKFHQEVILGDVGVDALGFDGLDAALAGTTTEYSAGAVLDWSGASIGSDAGKANDALDALDEFLALLDGQPGAIMGNKDGLARVRSLARRAGFYDRSRNSFGEEVETYRGIALVDLGERVASSAPVVPTETRTVGGAATNNLTDLYAVRFALDGFHGVSVAGQLIKNWPPDFTTAGANKDGEVEMGPVAVALKKSKSAGVIRNIKVR